MRQYFACLLLLMGVFFLGATYAGEVHREQARLLEGINERPRPTPELIAPSERTAPAENHSGMVYTVGTQHVVKGW